MKALLRLKKLNKREKYIVYGALCVLGILGINQLIINPFFVSKDRMKKNLHAKIAILEEMQQLRSEYEALTKNTQISKSRFASRQKGFRLFSFLDQSSQLIGHAFE